MVHQLDYWNQIIIFAVFAISLNLLMGYSGQASIAHAAFGAVGGYAAALLSVHARQPFLIGALVAVVLAFVIGVILSIPALGVGMNYVILLTLAFAYIITDLLTSINYFGGATGVLGVKHITVFGVHLISEYDIFVLFLVIGLLVLGLCWRIGESGYGRVLKGLREDEAATRSLGKNTVVFQATVFGLASALAGLAGAMFVYYFGNASPSAFSLNESILLVIMVVIGGSGSLVGSVVGAALITASTPVLENVIKVNPNTATYWQQSIYGLALIVIMIFRPAGLLPEHVAGRPRWWQMAAQMVGRRATARSATLAVAGADVLEPVEGDLGTVVTGGAAARPVGGGGRRALMATSRAASGGAGSSALGRSGPPGPGRGGAAGSGVLDLGAPDTPSSGAGGIGGGAGSAVAPILQVTDLWKRFGGITAVAGVTMEVPTHRVTALIGPNGAGKSTLFGLFTGFMRADGGSVVLKGQEVMGKSPNVIARLGMVRSFQDVRLFRYMTSLQNVMLAIPGQKCESVWRLFVSPRSVNRQEREVRERAMEVLEWVGMADRAHDLTGDLGHGEQKLVAIARSLATEADLLLLDEPTSGIDPEWVERVAGVIRELPALQRTVCVVEHNLGFLRLLGADCYFMEAGRIVRRGTLDDLMSEESLRRAYFGV